MIDQLALDYAAQGLPAVFLEQDITNLIPGNRWSRYYTAFTEGGGTSTTKPYIMLSSGHSITNGPVGDSHFDEYYSDYKARIDAELARPPQADVYATYWREGDHLVFDVVVKNLSGVPLYYNSNRANVTVIVYENTKVLLTSRFDRAVVSKSITTALANGATAAYSLQTLDLTGVDWTKLHAVALVEYRPAGTTGAYDMLQAAIAQPPALTVQPDTLVFLIDTLSPEDKTATINVGGGPSTLVWTATSNRSWLTASPASSTVGTSTLLHIDSSGFVQGVYTGTVTFTAQALGTILQKQVSVQVNMTEVFTTYLPLIQR